MVDLIIVAAAFALLLPVVALLLALQVTVLWRWRSTLQVRTLPESSHRYHSATPDVATLDVLPRKRAAVKDPPEFDGKSSRFKEWCFCVTLALKSLEIGSPYRQVDFASSFLVGNARLWLITTLESGQKFADWPALRDALGNVYSHRHDDEQVRLELFSIIRVRAP